MFQFLSSSFGLVWFGFVLFGSVSFGFVLLVSFCRFRLVWFRFVGFVLLVSFCWFRFVGFVWLVSFCWFRFVWFRFANYSKPLSRSSFEGQVTFCKENMAKKMKIYGLQHVKLCKYCSSVADVINNALQRVIAWRQNRLIGLLILPFVRV